MVSGPVNVDVTRFEAGRIIQGRYRLKGVLGKGGFGAVYEAEHTGTSQLVAVKVMLADVSEHNVQAVRRFYKEAQVTAQLRHPNTVRVFDVGQTSEGALYIAMERLHGPTLEEVLRELGAQGTAMPERQALDIAIPVLRSLGEAHTMDLVHRDLKPANIMLTEVADEEPVVKVLDFGIARTRDSSLTGQGTALGTPAYKSPEQCMGGNVDGRSDIYALGVILYRCVTGRTPFDDPNPLTVMYKHAHAPPPDPRDVAKSQLGEGFVACTLKALAKKPEQRFEAARALRLALEAAPAGRWAPGREDRALSERSRSVVARRRAIQGAAVSAPGLTRPYGGATDPSTDLSTDLSTDPSTDPSDAPTQARSQVVVRAERGTDAYDAAAEQSGLNAATEPDPAEVDRPDAPHLSQVLPAGKGVAPAAVASPMGEAPRQSTPPGFETAEVALASPAADPSGDQWPPLAPSGRSKRGWWLLLAVVLTSALWVIAWQLFDDSGPTELAEPGAPAVVPAAAVPAIGVDAGVVEQPDIATTARTDGGRTADSGAKLAPDAQDSPAVDAGSPIKKAGETGKSVPSARKKALSRKARRARRIRRANRPAARPRAPLKPEPVKPRPPKPPPKPEQPIPLD